MKPTAEELWSEAIKRSFVEQRPAEIIAIESAHRDGRREALEEAAKIAEDSYNESHTMSTREWIAAAIRARVEGEK